MTENERAIRVISRPSPVVNWTRNNLRRLDDTKRSLMRFAKSPPKHSLGQVYDICSEIACKHISFEEALVRIEEIKHPVTRQSAKAVIPIFFRYAKSHKIDGVEELKDVGIPFPIGRASDGKTTNIPVKPTFIAVHEGKLRPYFIIGWSKLAYNDYQKKLLSTIICRTLLTQQDYIGSDAQIVCLPRMKWSMARDIREWSALTYGTLSDDQLNEQIERYGLALAEVINELKGE